MAKETARKQAAHPPYLQMITEALTTLKERTGSSVPAMVKFLEQTYGPSLPENFRKMLTMQLKKLVESERLVKVKNSFKLSAEKPKHKSIPAATSKKEKIIKAASSNKDNKAKSKAAGPSKSGKGAGESDKKSQNAKVSEANKVVKKAMKTKRLSLVKSPDAVKNKKKAAAGVAKEKSKKVVKSGNAPGKSTKKKTANK